MNYSSNLDEKQAFVLLAMFNILYLTNELTDTDTHFSFAEIMRYYKI